MERGKHEVRLHEIDVLYGLGTLLAILGHSHPNDWSSFPGKWVEFIYLFHMPLFFLIAGFFAGRVQKPDAPELWKMALGEGAAAVDTLCSIVADRNDPEIRAGA